MKSTSTYTTMMRVTPDGRPFASDLHDIFAAMIFQIKLGDHRYLFRTYPSTFTTENMIDVLDHLQFTHVSRQLDKQQQWQETKTITTFSMTRTMAKQLGQHFLAARLIENATDSTRTNMKDNGIWAVTSKGKWMVNDFAVRGHIAWDKQSVTRTALQSVPERPVTLLSRYRGYHKVDTDALNFERPNMTEAFRHMMDHIETSKLLADDVGGLETEQVVTLTHTFYGHHVVDYIIQYMSVVNRDEAELVASEFVLYGWISQVLDKSDRANREKSDQVIFKSQRNTIYTLTSRGRQALDWDQECQSSTAIGTKQRQQHHSVLSDALSTKSSTSASSLFSVSSTSSSSPLYDQQRRSVATASSYYIATNQHVPMTTSTSSTSAFTPASTSSSSESSSSPTTLTDNNGAGSSSVKSSTTSAYRVFHFSSPPPSYGRLQPILEDPLLRMYFREFLRQNICEENLQFWVDYRNMLAHHQQDKRSDYNRTLSECYAIYVTYLATGASMELNIDHSLHHEIVSFMTDTFKIISNNDKHHPQQQHQIQQQQQQLLPFFYVPTHPSQEQSLTTTIITIHGQRSQCLKTLLGMYERVHHQVCGIMAEDSLPRFLKSPRYRQWQERQEHKSDNSDDGGDDDDVDRALAQQCTERPMSSELSSLPEESKINTDGDGFEDNENDDLIKELDRLTLTGVATTTTTTTTISAS